MPSSTTGTAIVGISVARQFCRKTNITRKTSTDRLDQRLDHLWIDRSMNGVVSIGIDDLEARREGWRELRRSCALTASAVVERVGARRQLDGEAGGRLAVVARMSKS